ncbi:MAG: hypothetical protein NDJ90_00265 [Oligoflexia bacterium]|nr:hypothetical protein [Oligoflexia bacterium]
MRLNKKVLGVALLLAASVAVAIAIAVYLGTRSADTVPPENAGTTTATPGDTSAPTGTASSTGAVGAHSAAVAPSGASDSPREDITMAEAEALFRTPLRSPSLGTIREETARDPHVTPPTLLSFGAELGARLTVAAQSEAKGLEFLDQLQECVTTNAEARTAPAAQAMCLIHGKWLTQRQPGLKGKFEELRAQAGPEAQSIFRMMTAGVSGPTGNGP